MTEGNGVTEENGVTEGNEVTEGNGVTEENGVTEGNGVKMKRMMKTDGWQPRGLDTGPGERYHASSVA